MPIPDKKAPVIKVNTEYVKDFSGGLNTTISGSLLNSKEAQLAEDITFEQKGTIVPRKGRRKRYDVPFTDDPISGLGQLYKQDGTVRLIVGAGTNLYSDKPNLVNKWSSKVDFEQEGTNKTKYIDTSDTESFSLRRNYLPRAVADCSDATLFIGVDVDLAVDTTTYKYNKNALKATLKTDKTLGYAKVTPTLDKTKLWVFSAYVCNGSADHVKLVALKADGSVLKGGSSVVSQEYVKDTLKLNVEDMKNVATLGLEVKGTATKYGYIDGLVVMPITQADYDNANYTAPDFTDVEPINASISATFTEGTGIDVDIGTTLKCVIGNSLNSVQNLSQGELTDITVVESKITIDTKLTWEPYGAITFDDLILL